jgi:hypothetical protein
VELLPARGMQITSYSISARQASAAYAVLNAADAAEGDKYEFHADGRGRDPSTARHARTVTRDSDTADDIVQDTLVRALRFAHLFQGDNVRSGSARSSSI